VQQERGGGAPELLLWFQEATLYLVEGQDPLHLLQALLGDLQALLLGQAAVTGQTGAQQQSGAFRHLGRKECWKRDTFIQNTLNGHSGNLDDR